MQTITVRDELSGSAYEVDAEAIVRTFPGRLARDNWATEEQVETAASEVHGAELWAPATDGREPRYLPVLLPAVVASLEPVEVFERDEWSINGTWAVTIGGRTTEVAAIVGVPEHQVATARAAASVRGLVDAWAPEERGDWLTAVEYRVGLYAVQERAVAIWEASQTANEAEE